MKSLDFLTADEYVHEISFCDVDAQDVNAIKNAFESGYKNVVFHSGRSLYSTACAFKYLSETDSAFSRVVYARFDRASHLYTASMGAPSVDEVLKESLCRPYILQDMREGKCFAENYLMRFEETADDKTLIILDGYDVAAPSPYMRHLFSLSSHLLVLSQKHMQLADCSAVMIDSDYKYEIPSIDGLDERQRELLMTLCAFLDCLDDAIPVVSSSSGIFDEASLKYLLGNLADELHTLAEYGFAKILPSGRIFVEADIRKYVLAKLCPCADNCKTFMAFAEKMCDFRMMQNVKDISAQIYAEGENYNRFASSLEFMSLYSRFAMSDANRQVKLYNILITYMLENFVGKDGASYTGHLLFKNSGYYVSLLSSELEEMDVLVKIYDEELYMDDLLPEIYTESIKAQLDIIRLCVCFVRNSTPDMYKRLECVFRLLCNAMKNIFTFAENETYPDDMKLVLADDVIRLCCESFDYFTVIDKDGMYCYSHDRFDRRRICYTGERESDKLYADSIMLGFSTLTCELYNIYSKYLDLWLRLSRKINVYHENVLLFQLYEEKLSDRQETLLSINAHFQRVVTGYENCVDIYSCDKNGGCSEICEKRIEDNKRYLRRGFDGGTKKGALRYAELVIKALRESKTPLNTALTVLSPDYPLSDEAYLQLKDRIVDALYANKNTTNFSMQLLLESVICFYSDGAMQNGRRGLYEHMICSLSERVSVTDAFLERMYHTVSAMYVGVKKKSLAVGFEDVVYEKYCLGKGMEAKYCDDYIADAIYSRINNIKILLDKEIIKQALKTYGFENNFSKAQMQSLYTFLEISE